MKSAQLKKPAEEMRHGFHGLTRIEFRKFFPGKQIVGPTMRATLILLLIGLAGCASDKLNPPLSKTQAYYLVCAVNGISDKKDTSRAITEHGPDIPCAAWPVEVQNLHPRALYGYQDDVVIVMQRNANEESGFYILSPSAVVTSSVGHSLPKDEEWSFKPLSCVTEEAKGDARDDMINYIYEYHRKIK